ncbi:MAG: pyruvate kinase [Phycisphaerales bacterium]
MSPSSSRAARRRTTVREALPLTRIVATLGPATASLPRMRRLLESGVTIARLNFSHGSFENHAAQLALVREASAAIGRTVAVLGDLRGPRIRVAPADREPVRVSVGDRVRFEARRSRRGISFELTEPSVLDDLAVGHRILVADGTIRLRVEAAQAGRVEAVVEIGGSIRGGKGINLPDTRVSLPVIGPHDERCIAWAVEHELDFLALSFVQRAEDLKQLRRLLGGSKSKRLFPPRIVAKIERPEAIERIDAIVSACDAVMVARGDLGAEMGLEAVPPLQRRILAAAHAQGRPAIVATEVLASMTTAATPTRAEVGDLSRAVLDEADAVMLSAETAIGRHPPRVVEAAASILRRAERWSAESPRISEPAVLRARREQALAHAAWQLAVEIGASMVVVAADETDLVRHLGQNGFAVPIAAVGLEAAPLRQLLLHRGVVPVTCEGACRLESGGGLRDAIRSVITAAPIFGLPIERAPWLAVGRLADGGIRPVSREEVASA